MPMGKVTNHRQRWMEEAGFRCQNGSFSNQELCCHPGHAPAPPKWVSIRRNKTRRNSNTWRFIGSTCIIITWQHQNIRGSTTTTKPINPTEMRTQFLRGVFEPKSRVFQWVTNFLDWKQGQNAGKTPVRCDILTLTFIIPWPISLKNPNFGAGKLLKSTKELMSASTDLWPQIRRLGIMLRVKWCWTLWRRRVYPLLRLYKTRMTKKVHNYIHTIWLTT